MLRSTTTEMRMVLVEIISILTLLSARTRNIFAAIPGLDFMPAPTSDNLTMFSSCETPFAPTSSPTFFKIGSAVAISPSGKVKEMSVVPSMDVFCTIMSTLTFACANDSNNNADTPGRSGTPSNVIFASPTSWTTPEIIGSSIAVFLS